MTIDQAYDYRQETKLLAGILNLLNEDDFDTRTLFKGWTINDVLGHLYMFDVAALRTLESSDAFRAFFAPIRVQLAKGKTLLQCQYPWLDGLKGQALLAAWRDNAEAVTNAYRTADPKQRVQWAGPEMSALSSITARQMETWAHGHEVFDVLGQIRPESDRIRNIAHLGVNTYGWAFVNRGMDVPDPAPYVRLTAPSGAVWEWNTPQSGNSVSGDAVEFAQVVTQVRSVGDTGLVTQGNTARKWMEIAQCFAGSPEQPPATGDRHRSH